MKKFVVDSTIPSREIDPVAWIMGTSKMLRDTGAKDIKFRTCYCCSAEGKVVAEFDAQVWPAILKQQQKPKTNL